VSATSKPNKAEVWKTVYRELIGQALIPVGIRLHPADISVTVQLQDDQFEDVAAALAAFGLPAGTTYLNADSTPHLWFEGEPGEFYTWGGYLNHVNSSQLLPGWEVNIYCQVRTVNFPLLPAQVTA
jgi:hypothetical protein